jgi:hypothetical protein
MTGLAMLSDIVLASAFAILAAVVITGGRSHRRPAHGRTTGWGNLAFGSGHNGPGPSRYPRIDDGPVSGNGGEKPQEVKGTSSGADELKSGPGVEPTILEMLPIKGAELDDAPLVESAVEEPVAIDHDAILRAENLVPEIHPESSVCPRTTDGRARARGESILAGARNPSTSTERAAV